MLENSPVRFLKYFNAVLLLRAINLQHFSECQSSIEQLFSSCTVWTDSEHIMVLV